MERVIVTEHENGSDYVLLNANCGASSFGTLCEWFSDVDCPGGVKNERQYQLPYGK